MKTWQMIKELTENPSKRFTYDTATEGSYVAIDGVTVVWQGPEQDGQLLGVNVANDDWKEVKKPVSFMDAVASGNKIKVEMEFSEIKMQELEGYKDYSRLSDFLNLLSRDFASPTIAKILQSCQFYIED